MLELRTESCYITVEGSTVEISANTSNKPTKIIVYNYTNGVIAVEQSHSCECVTLYAKGKIP